MKTRRFVAMLMSVALAAISFCGGVSVGWQKSVLGHHSGQGHDIEGFAVFWEAWDRLQQLFWFPGALDCRKMTYGAVRGVLASLNDPYSVFLEPAQHRSDSDRLQGEFEGIGVELVFREDIVLVSSVYPGSPAKEAGILPGDSLMSVDGTSTAGLPVDEVQVLIRGPVGTPVMIEVQRDAASSLILTMKRQRIEVPSLAWRLLRPGVGYLHIRTFTDRTPTEVARALGEMNANNVQAMVLDLRGNAGGTVEAAVGVLGQLLGEGVAYRELGKDATETRYPVPFNSQAVDWPLAVLVDAATASSAEIVAAAIHDHERGLLYGQPTFGKGSVQAIFPLNDGSSVHLTVARWLSSAGRALEDLGLLPDVVLESDDEQAEDTVLQAALNDLQRCLTYSTTSRPCSSLYGLHTVRDG